MQMTAPPATVHFSARHTAWPVWRLPVLAVMGAALILMLEGNRPLFLLLNQLGTHPSASFWASVTILGDGLVALVLLLPWVYRNPRLVWAGVLSGAVLALAVYALKQPIAALRPPGTIPLELFQVIGPAHTLYSFPSGHTATAFTLAAVVLLHLPSRVRQRWAWLIVAIAALVGVSRIVVGVHWPADVLAGAALGWLCALGGSAWAKRWHWGRTQTGRDWLARLLALCSVWLLLAHNTGYYQAVPWQCIVASAALLAAIASAVSHGAWQRLAFRRVKFCCGNLPEAPR